MSLEPLVTVVGVVVDDGIVEWSQAVKLLLLLLLGSLFVSSFLSTVVA